MSDVTLLAFNDVAKVEPIRIGRGAIELLRIDNVLQYPQGVAALAFTQSYSEDRSNLYPGFRAAAPERFSTALRAWLSPILQRTIDRDTTFFSVVATASKDLLPIQCIPHFDSTDPNLFAAVIYLCDSKFSGTVFYRHRKTGYEQITAANLSNYQLALNSDMRTHGTPRREYMAGDSVLFEAIFESALKFNSAIVYPASILHAARIEHGFERPKSKDEWRLTVTTLLQLA